MPKGRILAVDDQRYFREIIEGMLVEKGSGVEPDMLRDMFLRILP